MLAWILNLDFAAGGVETTDVGGIDAIGAVSDILPIFDHDNATNQ